MGAGKEGWGMGCKGKGRIGNEYCGCCPHGVQVSQCQKPSPSWPPGWGSGKALGWMSGDSFRENGWDDTPCLAWLDLPVLEQVFQGRHSTQVVIALCILGRDHHSTGTWMALLCLISSSAVGGFPSFCRCSHFLHYLFIRKSCGLPKSFLCEGRSNVITYLCWPRVRT